MTVKEDIIAKLMAVPIIKIDGEPIQSNIEYELAECIIKIKTTEDIVKQGKKYGFLFIIVGLAKYKTIIRKQRTVLNEPEDLRPYDNSIVPTHITFASSKKKNHARKEKEYEKYLEVTESIRTLILQAVD